MSNNEIEIKFTYEGEESSFKCKKNERLREIFQRIANVKQIDINSVYFLFKGNAAQQTDYDKQLDEFLPSLKENFLNIIVVKKNIIILCL